MHQPTFEAFEEAARGGANRVAVHRTLLADALTPVSAFLRIGREGPAFLFESVVGNEKIGRYSFLGRRPFRSFTARGRRLSIRGGGPDVEREAEDPFADLGREAAAIRAAGPESPPLFCGGAVGYAAYDAVRYVERLPSSPPDDLGLPDLELLFFDELVVFDHIRRVVHAVVSAPVEAGAPCAHPPGAPRVGLRAAYDAACARVDALARDLSTPGGEGQGGLPEAPLDLPEGIPEGPALESTFTRAGFERAVERSKEYIRAGDIFQVVLSQRIETPAKADPFLTYRVLRAVNPSPYMFFLRTPSAVLVGSSPEVMVRVEGGRVLVRPIAGTRPRGADEEEDLALEKELLADPKERAEHVMLLDLGRNDVGRVARYGSVQIPDRMVIERYSHVMHIVSSVTGELLPGRSALDALRACLPAGTVAGAPKVRAMQIIDELEPKRRGPYAGAVGYLDFRGNLDTCIAIRTILFAKGKAFVQAGAGIVADSVPSREYEETLNKARALLKGLRMAEAMGSLGSLERP